MKIDDKYKWLARDKDGKLWAYVTKPKKSSSDWILSEDVAMFYLKETDNTFSFIKWEDNEPTSAGDLRLKLANVKTMALYAEPNPINKPSHYIGINGLEVEEVTQNFLPRYTDGYVSHRVGSAIEYLLRAPLKNGLEDIEKAKENLQQIIDYENGKSKPLELDGNESDISTYYGGTNLGD